MEASFYEFKYADEVCKFINENNIKPISIIYKEYKYTLFFWK